MSKKFYTADHHFYHRNIMSPAYCDRPYNDLYEMQEALIANHNEVVGKNDEVFFLGDVCMDMHRPKYCPEQGVEKHIERVLRRMNGRKHLIMGNHDPRPLCDLDIWESASDYKVVNDRGRKVVLFHFPIYSWEGRAKGAVHLHGHCHGTLKVQNMGDIAHGSRGFWCDVGVDCWDYKPVELNTIIDKMYTGG